ncbi:MAG: hypothetical protein ACT4SY_12345 [Hyphomicrobiales bacterium]
MKIIDQQHPFYKPLWRRVAIVAAVAAWFGYEAIFTRDPLWLAVSGGILAYAAWTLLWTWPKGPAGPET